MPRKTTLRDLLRELPRPRSDNAVRVPNVSYRANARRFVARATIDGKRQYLGFHTDLVSAARAVLKAKGRG